MPLSLFLLLPFSKTCYTLSSPFSPPPDVHQVYQDFTSNLPMIGFPHALHCSLSLLDLPPTFIIEADIRISLYFTFKRRIDQYSSAGVLVCYMLGLGRLSSGCFALSGVLAEHSTHSTHFTLGGGGNRVINARMNELGVLSSSSAGSCHL